MVDGERWLKFGRYEGGRRLGYGKIVRERVNFALYSSISTTLTFETLQGPLEEKDGSFQHHIFLHRLN